MGWSSEMHIEQHNSMMENDAEYAESYARHEEESFHYNHWCEEQNRIEYYLDWFADWRLDWTGYQEFEDEIFEAQIIGEIVLEDEDLPF